MYNYRSKPFIFFFLVLSALPCLSLGQAIQTVIHLTEVIDEAELVIIGKVVDEKWLYPERFDVRTDGWISTINIERVLKGTLDTQGIEVAVVGDRYRARRVHIVPPEKYLLSLNRFEVPSTFVERYGLHGRTFYYPTYDELGVINLNEKDGPDYLRRTEDHLRGLPPVPSPTVSAGILLDSLIIKKHQAFETTMIGDKNFVNELDNRLENAQKHLLRGDSLQCRYELEGFQDRLQREYERTRDREKKNEPKDKRFVTKEGYTLLYYNAKYIIDRLPKKN